MGELEDRKLEGTIVYAVLGRLHYGFDVFTLDLPHALSLHSQPKFPNHNRLTDGKSVNYNAQFVTSSDAKLLLQGAALSSPESNPRYEEVEQEMLVYVSERTGNARLHFSSAKAIGPVLGPLKGTVNDFEHPAFFFDRPVVRNGRAYFVSMQEPSDRLLKSWCAVYATCLETGQTIRLTPRGVADYSPAVSPSGKWVMVASYGAKEWERDHIQDLHTDLYVFKAEDGSCRRMVTEQGGWPSWADENVVYFHRRAEDGFWSIYRLNLLDGSVQPERITPPSVDAFTSCASATGNWIAVATRRPQTKFRHIEIFDLQSKSFIPVTVSISPGIHHYNPFISSDSLKLGFHRFRGKDAEDADTVVPVLEGVESPIPKLKLQRINGAFPAFSPDGSLIAFNPNVGVPDGGVHVVKADGSKRWELFKGPAFAVVWNGKHQGLLYASVGPVFASNQSTVHVIYISFKPEELGEEFHVKSEVRVLTKEGTRNNAFPYSSPDGKQLVFRSGRSGHKNLYIMDAEEGEEGWIRPLTEGPWIDTMPCWSPDGQWIAFSSNRHDPLQDEFFSVYLIHPDGTAFLFWYSCLHLSMCSFWVAFGIFVTRIFLETACFVAFLLISHGYCIMHEQLSISERRSIAGMVSLLYLTLTGYKAAVPQFSVFMMLIYLLMLYVIFLHLSKNIAFLREQLRNIEDDGVQVMHTAVYTKYSMFKKFKAAMLMMVLVEILMNLKCNGVASEYWVHLLVREWTEIIIFFYIGWTFRSRELTPFFTIVPTQNSMQERTLPPIFSIEMNEKDFNNLNFKEWHIGVPTSKSMDGDVHWPMLVVVQHPSASRDESFKDVPCSEEAVGCVLKSSKSNINISRSISSPLLRSHSFSLVPDSTSLESLQSSSQSSQYHAGPKGSNGERYYKNENQNFSSSNKVHEKDIMEYMPDVLVDIKGIRNFSFDSSGRSKRKECRELQNKNLEQQSFVVHSSTLAL